MSFEDLVFHFLKEHSNQFSTFAPNDFERRRSVSSLKIKIHNKKSRRAALGGGV
jgi:hypothetical protein